MSDQNIYRVEQSQHIVNIGECTILCKIDRERAGLRGGVCDGRYATAYQSMDKTYVLFTSDHDNEPTQLRDYATLAYRIDQVDEMLDSGDFCEANFCENCGVPISRMQANAYYDLCHGCNSTHDAGYDVTCGEPQDLHVAGNLK